jgi:hypothetical protein
VKLSGFENLIVGVSFNRLLEMSNNCSDGNLVGPRGKAVICIPLMFSRCNARVVGGKVTVSRGLTDKSSASIFLMRIRV